MDGLTDNRQTDGRMTDGETVRLIAIQYTTNWYYTDLSSCVYLKW